MFSRPSPALCLPRFARSTGVPQSTVSASIMDEARAQTVHDMEEDEETSTIWDSESDIDKASASEKAAPPAPEAEPPPPEPIPDDIVKTAREVMGAFDEIPPDEYV